MQHTQVLCGGNWLGEGSGGSSTECLHSRGAVETANIHTKSLDLFRIFNLCKSLAYWSDFQVLVIYLSSFHHETFRVSGQHRQFTGNTTVYLNIRLKLIIE